MKTTYKIVLIILIFQNCSAPNYKDKLIGNWSVIFGNLEFEFYSDSLVANDVGLRYINTWTIDNSKIYLDTIEGRLGIEYPVFDYKLSNDNDSLFIKRPTESDFRYPIFRIKSAYDLLLKEIQLSIKLPKKDNIITHKEKNTGLNVYVGYRNNNLIAKTNYDGTNNLKDINLEALAFISYRYAEFNSSEVHFNLLVDKNVKKNEIDSIKSLLKETDIKKIFRIYTNDKIDYTKLNWRSELNWHGIYE